MATRTPTRRRSRTDSGRFTRSQVVWLCLLGAMTSFGALLLALQDRPGTPPSAFASAPAADARTAPRLDAIFRTTEAIGRGQWSGIVIHHSGAPAGSAETIERQHADRGLRGLGYHFVIANGQGAPDGQIHVGYRWDYQLPGAHTAGPQADQLNRSTIGICLVGDGERRAFTEAQLARLADLVTTLQRDLGIPDDAVTLHRDVAPTTSPGRLFPEAAFRAILAESR